MTKVFCCLSVLTICGASLLAQSTRAPNESINRATQTVKSLAGESSDIAPDNTPDAAQPPMLNIFTVIGDNLLGLPCLDCVLGITLPTLGLPSPVGQAVRGSAYQIDAYLIDNTYTGSCTFTFAVRDSHKNVIFSSTQTLMENANTEILVSVPVTIPTNASIGLGSVSTTAVCGTSTTKSSSPVYLACVTEPPFCVD
jgi:hypothetical protein